MKKFLAIAIISLISISTLTAAKNSGKETQTTTFSVNVDCHKCEEKIMNTVAFERGVKDVDVDLQKREATITFNPAKNSNQQLIESFKKIDIKAKVIEPQPQPKK